MAPTIAFAISSHGFGHAARASAVMESLLEAEPEVQLEVFTGVPPWFLTDWLPRASITVHPEVVDIGLVQSDALTIDFEASIERLNAYVDAAPGLIRHLANRFVAVGADLVIADIAPVALEAAGHAGLPSILIENFTWDFIYSGLQGADPKQTDALQRVSDVLATWNARASLHIQVEPCCHAVTSALQVPVVARRPRTPRSAVRQALGVSEEADLALVTMGGIPWHRATTSPRVATAHNVSTSLGPVTRIDGVASGTAGLFVVMASDSPTIERQGSVIWLPHRSGFYHPDLVAAADVIVAKLGYSTVAETATSGRGLAYVPRPDFPESPHLEAWAVAHLATERIESTDLSGRTTIRGSSDRASSDRASSDRSSSGRSSGIGQVLSPRVEEAIAQLLARRTGNRSDSMTTPTPNTDGARLIATTILDLDCS